MKEVIAGLLLLSFPLLILAQNINNTQLAENQDNTTSDISTDTTGAVKAIAPENGNNENATINAEKGYNDGFADGREQASKKNQTSWSAYGCTSGVLLPCIGPCGVWLIANSPDAPPYIPNGSSDYRAGYTDGYMQTTKSIKKTEALFGGIQGTLIAGAITFIIISVIEDDVWEGGYP